MPIFILFIFAECLWKHFIWRHVYVAFFHHTVFIDRRLNPTRERHAKLGAVHYYTNRPMTSMFVDVCRLSESNLQPISSQIEALFRSYSRAELSETLARIVFDACVSWSRIPERLITEHVLLIAILHRNVGSEVGEIFQHFSNYFSPYLNQVFQY